MNYFYSKQIDIYKYVKDKDENMFVTNGYELESANVLCDIQPTSSEKIEKSYGYKVDCTHKIYSDIEIKESDVILYNGATYKVKKSIPWDDYFITAIKAEVVKLNG